MIGLEAPRAASTERDDDAEIVHFTCCCTDDVSLCGLDITELPFTSGDVDDAPWCPLCALIWDDGGPCPHCGGPL